MGYVYAVPINSALYVWSLSLPLATFASGVVAAREPCQPGPRYWLAQSWDEYITAIAHASAGRRAGLDREANRHCNGMAHPRLTFGARRYHWRAVPRRCPAGCEDVYTPCVRMS